MCVGVLLWSQHTHAASIFRDRLWVQGFDALQNNDSQNALRLFGDIADGIQNDELADSARFLAAQAAQELGEFERAAKFLNGLENKLPEIADYVFWAQAKNARFRDDWAQALNLWQKLLQRFPNSALASMARYSVADAHLALGRLFLADQAYRDAVNFDSTSERVAIARFNLAWIAEHQRRFPEAARDYQQLAYVRPTDLMSNNALERLQALVAARHVAPPSLSYLRTRFDKLLAAQLLDEAAAALELLVAENKEPSESADLRFRRAQLAFRRRDFEVAIKQFVELRDIATGSKKLEYQSWLARCYSAKDEADAAVAMYAELAETKRSSAREYLYKAGWLAYNGRNYPTALRFFNEFLTRYPRDGSADEALWFYAWSAYRSGDLLSALASLDRLRDEFPKSSLVQRTLYWRGRILMQIGRAEEARVSYQQAQTIQPLNYYALMADRRLREDLQQNRPVANALGEVQFASLNDNERASSPPEPEAVDLPAFGQQEPMVEIVLPWGSALFDWNSNSGKRLLRLAQLGMNDAAAQIAKDLPLLPGHSIEDAAYARSQLLYMLGDYHGSYRIAGTVFREKIQGQVSGKFRRYYHLAYPLAKQELVAPLAEKFSVPPLLIFSLMRQESAFNTKARSWASAQGLLQIIPATGRKIAEAFGTTYSQGMLNIPDVNVRFGVWYISELLRKFHGNVVLAIAAYNAGPQAVARWLDNRRGTAVDEFVEEIPYRETRGYVRNVLSNLAVYSELYVGDFPAIPESVPEGYLNNIDF